MVTDETHTTAYSIIWGGRRSEVRHVAETNSIHNYSLSLVLSPLKNKVALPPGSFS